MKFKRLLATVLCVILSLCVFAGGCGLFEGPSDNNKNDKPDKPSIEQPVEDEGVFTITFDAGAHGTLISTTRTTEDGRLATLPVPTVSGDYTFLGWYTAETDGEKVGTSYAYTSDITLYAHYQQKQVKPEPVEYTVTLNAGSHGMLPAGTAAKLTTVNGKIASLPTPTANGDYTFLGWYTAETGGVKVAADYAYTADTALYAQYQKKTVQVSPAKFLKTDGRNVKTQDGKTVYLRGTNAGGLFVTEHWMTGFENGKTDSDDYRSLTQTFIKRFGEEKTKQLWAEYRANWWTDVDFKNCADMGMTAIRLPFTYMNVDFAAVSDYDNAGKSYDFSALDEFVSKAAEYGMYTVLDLHGAYGSQNGQDHSGQEFGNAADVDFYSNERMQTLTVNLWSALSEHYKDNPAVAGYDILNEPGEKGGFTGEAHWNFYDKVYDAIRATGDNHIVIFESCWEASNLPKPSKYGWENCMYSFHHYIDDKLSVDEHVSNWEGKLSGIEAENFGLPLQMGEFTAYGSKDKWEKTLLMMNNSGWHWTSWTYKVWGNMSWGIVNVTSGGNKVDPANDSYNTIVNKFKNLRTGNATKYSFGGTTLESIFKKYLSGWEQPSATVDEVSLTEIDGKPYAVFSGTCLKRQDLLSSYVIDGEISGRVKLNLKVSEHDVETGRFVLVADISGLNNGRYYLHAGFEVRPENLSAEIAKIDTANSTVIVGGKTYSLGEEWGCRQIVVA